MAPPAYYHLTPIVSKGKHCWHHLCNTLLRIYKYANISYAGVTSWWCEVVYVCQQYTNVIRPFIAWTNADFIVGDTSEHRVAWNLNKCESPL